MTAGPIIPCPTREELLAAELPFTTLCLGRDGGSIAHRHATRDGFQRQIEAERRALAIAK